MTHQKPPRYINAAVTSVGAGFGLSLTRCRLPRAHSGAMEAPEHRRNQAMTHAAATGTMEELDYRESNGIDQHPCAYAQTFAAVGR